MKTTLLSVLFTIVTLLTYAQKPKIFIEYNNESEGWIALNLEKTNNWEIVGTADKSNVILRVQMSESGYKATGKLYIIDSKTEETIYTSPTLKGQSSAFNGYAPKKDLCRKLINDVEENFDKKKINLTSFGTNKPSSNGSTVIQESDKYDKLKKLKELLDQGIISQAEFDKEKKKILESEK